MTPKIAWHFDFHTPGYVTIGENPDFAGMARSLRKTGIDEIITFAKCHYGYSYYPTKVGTVHPGLKVDILGGIISNCRKKKIRVIAYISFGIDGQAGINHPEWQMITDREPFIPEDKNVFLKICPFTPYLDELMLPQIEEIINLYKPDGFFFDTMSAFGVCHCQFCKDSFKKETGEEIPVDDTSPLKGLYGRWRHDRGIALIKKISSFIHEKLKGALIGFNQIGSLPYPEKLPEEVTVLTLDPPTNGPQSLQIATNAAYSGLADRPADIIPTIFNQGWGDWSLAPLTRLEKAAVTIWSHGARLYVGDRLRPEGRLDPQTLVALKFVKKLKNKFEKILPEPESTLKPDILILHTPEIAYGDDYAFFAAGKERVYPVIGGSHRMLLEAGANTEIAGETYLKNWLYKAKLLILPEMTYLKFETASLIRKWVEDGGFLLVVGSLPQIDGKDFDWAGVRCDKEILLDHIYLSPWQEKDLPVLVRGSFHKIILEGAEMILPAILPYQAKPGQSYGWGIGPACFQPSDYPVLTRYNTGKGQVWYLGAHIFTDYYKTGKWQQLKWLKELLTRLPANYSVMIDSPSGDVECVLWEKQKTWWIILVNHAGEQIIGTTAPVWARNVGEVPHRSVTIKINNKSQKPLRIFERKKNIDFSFDGESVQFDFVLKDVCRVFRVDWE